MMRNLKSRYRVSINVISCKVEHYKMVEIIQLNGLNLINFDGYRFFYTCTANMVPDFYSFDIKVGNQTSIV